MRGRTWFAAVRPRGKPEGMWVLPKGLIDPGETPAETALREGHEETGVHGRLVSKLGDVRYVYTWRGERVFKIVSFYLATAVSGRDRRDPAGDGARGRGCTLAPARRRTASSRVSRRTRHGEKSAGESHGASLYSCAAAVPTFALNFYNPAVADQLRSHRKTATIRLGDKSSKYRKGMIVTVLAGARFGPARAGVRRGRRQGRGQAARRSLAA